MAVVICLIIGAERADKRFIRWLTKLYFNHKRGDLSIYTGKAGICWYRFFCGNYCSR
jgi:hypothetical protein